MLPKNNRISRVEFSGAVFQGKRHHSPIFTLYITKTSNPKDKKFAFSVSKKVCKGAVGRNKLRRQGYSVLKTKIDSIKEGFLYLFVYKKTQKLPNHKEIEQDIISLLTSAFVLV